MREGEREREPPLSYGAVCWRAIGEILQSFSLLFVVFPMATTSFVLTQCILAWDEFQRIMGTEQSESSPPFLHSRDWERSRWRRSIKILRQAENQTTERRKKEGIREVRKWLISPRPPFVAASLERTEATKSAQTLTMLLFLWIERHCLLC